EYTVIYGGADAVTLAPGDISVQTTGTANAVLSLLGSGAFRTVRFDACTGNGTVAFTLAAGTAYDAVGNLAASAGPSAAFIVDTTAPVISVLAHVSGDPQPAVNGTVDDP